MWQYRIALIASALGLFDTLLMIPGSFSSEGATCGEVTYLLQYSIDCGSVTTSVYSRLAGIPLTIFGFIYYLGIFFLLMRMNDLKFLPLDHLHLILTGVVTAGFLISIYLVVIQFAVLYTICLYCMGSALACTFLYAVIGIPGTQAFIQQQKVSKAGV